MDPILSVDRVSKRFGPLVVTDDISVRLREGEALGVIGPNGAGKTTLFNLITGVLKPNTGRIKFQGEDVTRLPPSARCRAGIARSFQVPHPFSGMTVFENTLVGATFGGRRDERPSYQPCIAILKKVGLLPKADTLAGSLRLLDRKRLELARALASEPRLLLLDEIAGGLTEHETAELIEIIREIRNAGISIIWIEHVVHALTAVVDRLIAINFGRLLADGAPAEVMASPAVREVYMGIAPLG
jgi:branched-chain amino acid transport system ATP-binding protein